MNGNKNDPHILINNTEQHWASENFDMKVYNDHTVSTTTTLNSKYDPMTSLATSPTPSYNLENGAKATINSSNLINKLNESDKLITWTRKSAQLHFEVDVRKFEQLEIHKVESKKGGKGPGTFV